MKLSVVVPCHDEQDVVRELYARVVAATTGVVDDLEVVFVDDGSRDQTLTILRSLAAADPRVRYVGLSRNFGKESAMLAGLRETTGDAVVIMDADLQHPPDLIPAMLDLFTHGIEQVVARRTRRGDPWFRSVLSRLYYRVMNQMIDVPLDDGQGDFRLLSRRAVDVLLTLPEVNRFSKGLFGWIGFPQATLDYENVPRAGGRSTWSFGRLVNYGLDGMISFNNKPLRLCIWLGLSVVAASLLYLLWLVGNALTFGIDVPGYITIIAVVTLLGGIQLVCTGIIGEYIGRVYYEVKRRPHYVVGSASHEVVQERHRVR